MTLQITITPPAIYSSPSQIGKAQAPVIQNDGFFSDIFDVLDVVNPLQHIPVIGSLYRSVSGDTLSSGARIAGGALFGGPLGLIASIANEIALEISGEDIPTRLFASAASAYEKTSQIS